MSRPTCRAATSCSRRRGRATGEAIARRSGRRRASTTKVLLRTGKEMAKAVAGQPVPRRRPDEGRRDVPGLRADAKALRRIDVEAFAPEALTVHGSEIYLHLPGGQARSKLAAALAKVKNRGSVGDEPQLAHRRGPRRHDAGCPDLAPVRSGRGWSGRASGQDPPAPPQRGTRARAAGRPPSQGEQRGRTLKEHPLRRHDGCRSASMTVMRTGPGATSSNVNRPRRSVDSSSTGRPLPSSTVNAPGGISWPTIRRDGLVDDHHLDLHAREPGTSAGGRCPRCGRR